MASEGVRPARPALQDVRNFARMMKGFLAFEESLKEIDDYDAIIDERKRTITDLEAKIATLESDAVKRAVEIDEVIDAANARKSSIEAKITASKNALSVINEKIAEADRALETAITTRSDNVATATAEAEQRLALLNRDIAQAEERLTATQSSIQKLREHLAV